VVGSQRRSMILMFRSTGTRLMELTALALDDLDWKTGNIRIRMGKGQKERVVPLYRGVQGYLSGIYSLVTTRCRHSS
jgi:site-specific recombinase XerD